MRILYLTHQYFPQVGGTEVYTRGLVRRARAAGHDAMVVTCHESPSGDPRDFRTELADHEGVPVVEVHFNLSVTPDPVRCEYDNSFAGRAVFDVLASYRPDVVHAMHAMKLSGAALEACYRAGVPVLVTLCDYWFLCPRHTLLDHAGKVCSGPDHPGKCEFCVQQLHGFPRPLQGPHDRTRYVRELATLEWRPLYLRRLLERARRVVALSEFQKRTFVANGFRADRIEVIPHGVEVADLAGAPSCSAGHPRRLKRVGFVGSLVPHKGAHVLLEALARVPDLPLECLVHGPLRPGDGYTEQLRALAQRDARVRLLGGFEPAQFGAVLRNLDLLAVPAVWHENEPLVVKAALHLGVPLLASLVGSLTEIVREGHNGWLVPPGDPAAWADALVRLASRPLPEVRPSRVKTMDENAREWLAIYEQEARPRQACRAMDDGARALVLEEEESCQPRCT